MRHPFPRRSALFTIVPVMIGVIWVLTIGGIGTIAYVVLAKPELIGQHIGRAVNGFSGAAAHD